MPTLSLRSSISNAEWPAIPSPAASSLLGTLFAWNQTEGWTAAQIEQAQFKQLGKLVQWAQQHVPYYADCLDGIDTRNLSTEGWRTLPTLSRTQLQEHYVKLKSDGIPNGHGNVDTRATSGSTGTPVKVDCSELTSFLWHVGVLRDHVWHRRDFSAPLASIRHVKFDPNELGSNGKQSAEPPHGLTLPNWGPTVSQCFNTGPAHVLSIHSRAEEQADWLDAINAGYLQTYPSNLQKLCDYYQRSGRAAPQFMAIRTISEALDSNTRKSAQRVFGAPVQDLYSTTEVGYIAVQCPEHEHFHVQSETVYVEVLNDGDQPCAPGEIGRVLVTPLHNFAMPLIRYELGDYAEVGQPCDCGRNSLVLKRVLGRSRNLLTFPDGRTDWPVFQDTRFREIAPIVQFQFTQTSVNDIEMNLVVERDLTADEQQQLSTLVLNRLGHPFNLTLKFVSAIARSKSGKYEDFISIIR